MVIPTNEQLAYKLQDLIEKHNLLVQAVDQISQSIEHINEMLFASTGITPATPNKLDS